MENLETIVAAISILITLCSTGYAIYQKIKGGKYLEAVVDANAMLGEAAKAIDGIKKESDLTDIRPKVTDVLKGLGSNLDNLGLKEKMDQKLKELGLDDKS